MTRVENKYSVSTNCFKAKDFHLIVTRNLKVLTEIFESGDGANEQRRNVVPRGARS